MRAVARPPIEQLSRDLHAAILRALQPSADTPPMSWQEFGRRARLEKWTRHAHWKLREGQLRWGPDRLIEIAGRLGIRTTISVEGPLPDSCERERVWPPGGDTTCEMARGSGPTDPTHAQL